MRHNPQDANWTSRHNTTGHHTTPRPYTATQTQAQLPCLCLANRKGEPHEARLVLCLSISHIHGHRSPRLHRKTQKDRRTETTQQTTHHHTQDDKRRRHEAGIRRFELRQGVGLSSPAACLACSCPAAAAAADLPCLFQVPSSVVLSAVLSAVRWSSVHKSLASFRSHLFASWREAHVAPR